MLFYIRYIIFCIKLLFNLRHYRDFLEYDPKRSKKYVLESRKSKEKIKLSIRRQEKPKMADAFLAMFYDTISLDSSKEFVLELEGIFALTYIWHETLISDIKKNPDSKMRE